MGQLSTKAGLLSASAGKSSPLGWLSRDHRKMIAVDGEYLYVGSANFTGAGLGARSDGRRNFELGLSSDDDVLLDAAQSRFDRIWRGAECGSCRLRSECPKPIDLLVREGARVGAVSRSRKS